MLDFSRNSYLRPQNMYFRFRFFLGLCKKFSLRVGITITSSFSPTKNVCSFDTNKLLLSTPPPEVHTPSEPTDPSSDPRLLTTPTPCVPDLCPTPKLLIKSTEHTCIKMLILIPLEMTDLDVGGLVGTGRIDENV